MRTFLLRVKGPYRYERCMLIMAICVLGITFATMIDRDVISSLFFAAGFCTLFIEMIIQLQKNSIKWLTVVIIVLSTASCVINVILSSTAIVGFEYFNKLILFIATIVAFDFAISAELRMTISTRIVRIMAIMPIITPVSYFVLSNERTIGGFITLNYSNPNLTGMWLMSFIGISLYEIVSCKKMWYRIFSATIMALNIYLMMLTGARGSIVALIAFAAMLGVGLFKKKVYVPKYMLRLINLLPIIVAIVYLLLVQAKWFHSMFDFMATDGKLITSRADVWEYAISVIRQNPVMGDYYGISNGTGVSQLHNMHMDIAASYGIPSLILFIVFTKKMLLSVSKTMDLKGYVAFASFIALHICGCFEAGIIVGSLGLNYMAALFLLLAHQSKGEVEND